MSKNLIFNPDCIECPRLADFLVEVKQQYPNYHARPVADVGVAIEEAKLLVVGLAPGMHGANATARPFTGDYAGLLLYQTLHKFGFSNKAESIALNDGLELIDARITNAVKCLPPQNKPTTAEIKQCNHYLKAELQTLPKKAVILVLGTIAHQSVLRAYDLKLSSLAFGHNVINQLADGRYLVSSYHTSRYNIQTKRLTTAMFEDVFMQIKQLMADG